MCSFLLLFVIVAHNPTVWPAPTTSANNAKIHTILPVSIPARHASIRIVECVTQLHVLLVRLDTSYRIYNRPVSHALPSIAMYASTMVIAWNVRMDTILFKIVEVWTYAINAQKNAITVMKMESAWCVRMGILESKREMALFASPVQQICVRPVIKMAIVWPVLLVPISTPLTTPPDATPVAPLTA